MKGKITSFRLPKKEEVFGIVAETLGFDRFRVKCRDGKTRICRVPGRMRKRVWIRNGDLVIVKPWEVQSEDRGDISYRYSKTEGERLTKRGVWKED